MDILTLAAAKAYTDKVGEKVSREGFRVQVEQGRDILQEEGEEKVFYFIPKEEMIENNYYDEYIYAENRWEQVGSTDIDLSNFVTSDELEDFVTSKILILNGTINESDLSITLYRELVPIKYHKLYYMLYVKNTFIIGRVSNLGDIYIDSLIVRNNIYSIYGHVNVFPSPVDGTITQQTVYLTGSGAALDDVVLTIVQN